MKDSELIEEFWVSQGGKPHLAADIWFYESDWNMLMPVVEKIEGLGFRTSIGYTTATKIHGCNFYNTQIDCHDVGTDSKMLTVYRCVVKLLAILKAKETITGK
jgi:hypothetical protein